ncbi:MAG: EAL domain-containing protein [Myxococcota bacterium]
MSESRQSIQVPPNQLPIVESIDLNADPKLVLIVDDDDMFRLVARASLEGAGFRVEEAENGRVGIAMLEETRPDIVLLDIRMPEMDGYDTCAALRSLPEGWQTPIVMLTAVEDRESIERAYEVGATDFINKPVNYAILNYRLQHILRANRFLVDFDRLTGLPNRALVLDYLERAVALGRRCQHPVAILFLDLDHFRRFNETLGHRVGDDILRQVADRLGSLRSTDYVARNCDADHTFVTLEFQTIARLGGDEFVVVLPKIRNVEDCAVVARRIRKILARPFEVADGELYVTASIGISAYPLDGEEPQALLTHAEVAMNHAKEKGRDRYQFYQESLNTKTQRSFSIENQLRRVLERDELEVYYQPKVDIQHNRLAGMEALARWPESLEAVSPGEFIPIAEQTGLIVPLGDWVFRTACAQTAEMLRMGLPTPGVSINLSAAQFGQEGIASHMARIVDEMHFDPALVELELTEGVLLEDTDTSIATLNELREIGFTIALDDFGTGYSSLSYLKRFPLNTLKLDQLFVRDLAKDSDAAIAKAIIVLGHTLSLKVIAEGVEEPKQLDLLQALGCDEVQGYLFSRPLPFEAFVEWTSEWETTSASPLMQGVAASLRGPDEER